jgi:hypothetical protein
MYGHLSPFAERDGWEYLLLYMPDMILPILQKDYRQILSQLQAWYATRAPGESEPDDQVLTKLEIAATRASGKPDGDVFLLLASIRENRPLSAAALDVDAQMMRLLQKTPLLSGLAPEAAAFLRDAVACVLRDDLQAAFDEIFRIAESDSDMPAECAEGYLVLAQSVCAAAEYTEGFIFFKKQWIAMLVEQGRLDEAHGAVAEYREILPDDVDILALERHLLDVRRSGEDSR